MLQKKSCFSWILSKEGKKKKGTFSSWAVFVLWFQVRCYHWKLFWPLEIFGPSDLWCLGHWYSPTPSLLLHGSYISIPPSIHTYNYLPLSLSHSSGIWSVLGFPYTSFIELVSFPRGCFLPVPDFLFLHPVISLSILPSPDPLPFSPCCQFTVVLCIQHNIYIFKWDDFH